MEYNQALKKYGASSAASRVATRAGKITGPTSSLSPGALQANLVILPSSHSQEFASFCELNPCPLLASSKQGDPFLPSLGVNIDVHHDLPRYHIWRDGEVSREAADVAEFWHSDLIAFPLGCSFGFESALIDAGIPLRHIEHKRNVAMYNTNIPLKPSRTIQGEMVVSMRPVPAERVKDVTTLCEEFPLCYSVPVHIGGAGTIGINDISFPDYGDSVSVNPDEVLVLWACGLTPQNVIRASKVPFTITNAPVKTLIRYI